MKMKIEHFEHLKTECNKVLSEYPNAINDYKKAGLSAKRFRWDIWRAAGLLGFTCDTLYKYLNDVHIDTALRNIVSY